MNLIIKKYILLFIALIFALPSLLLAKNLVNTSHSGLAIQGYDPVSYFLDIKPEKGLLQFSSTVHGVTYLFSSAQHKELFDANSSKYEPQFGGYCAYGVSNGNLVSIDPMVFQIVQGELLLQNSKRVMVKFNKNQLARLKKAHDNWTILLDKKGN